MPDLELSVAALTALHADLGASRDGLATALRAMADGSAAGLGGPDLDRACADFRDAWAFGLGKLGECVDAVAGNVMSARNMYADTEDVIKAAFDKLRAATETTG